VFALGAVLAFVMGIRPFGEGPSEALTYRVVHKAPVLDGLPDPLRDIVAGCLDKDPGARPEPAELLETLSSAGDNGAWLPAPVEEMLTRYPVHSTRVLTDTPPPPLDTARTRPAPASGGDHSVHFKASLTPVALALVGHTLRLLLGIGLGALVVASVMSPGSRESGGVLFILALLFAAAFWLIRLPATWMISLVNALRKPCELRVDLNGLELQYSGRRVLYRWHEIGRVVVRRAESAGWSICVFPFAGTALPAARGPRTPLCYLDRKTGWIVVVPVHRLKGSRKEIEMTLARYAGPRWGGNA
jgi:eukaryotic-like serine/threonine-protein kinase